MASSQITLTADQQRVLTHILEFVRSKNDRVFILKGYAGTGKTTLMRFLIRKLHDRGKPFRLLAPTGRAAKVMSNISEAEEPATTIHSLIYTFKGMEEEKLPQEVPLMDATGQLLLNFEPITIQNDQPTVYIIDEASMIADIESKEVTQAKFGSGKLLTELLGYDPCRGSKFIFVGDPCQLPPVEQYFSPALDADYFRRNFNIGVQEEQLTQIMRQTDGNDIVRASKSIRILWHAAPETKGVYGSNQVWGHLPFCHYNNIHFVPGKGDLYSRYVNGIKQHGFNHAIFICRSNSARNSHAAIIRRMLGKPSGQLTEGDLLLINQNNYLTGLSNGDMVEVTRVTDKIATMAGLSFRYIKVKDLANNKAYDTWIIEDLLYQSLPNLGKMQQTALFIDFINRMAQQGIKEKSEAFYQCMREDPFINALRCTFGYAVTCNKAQGGEWDDVYIDMPRNITLNPTKSEYQWVYTAMTRARNQVWLVTDFFYNG